MGNYEIEWLDDDGVPLPKSPPDQPVVKRSRRRAKWALVGVLAAAATVAGLIVGTRSSHPHPPTPAAHPAHTNSAAALRACASLASTNSATWQPVLDGPGCTINGATAAPFSIETCSPGVVLYATTDPGPGYWGRTGDTLHRLAGNPTQDPAFTAAFRLCEDPTPSPPDLAARRPRDPSDLAGARIALPHGWVALQLAAFEPSQTEVSPDTWCIAPAGISAADVWASCPIRLQSVATQRIREIEPELAGGFIGNPGQGCAPTTQLGSHEDTADLSLGGRASLYRRWTFTCSGHHVPAREQYVVPTQPAFVLFSDRADQTVRDTMAHIAQHSTLPAQIAPLYLLDRGYVRSMERQTNGSYLVRIDRVAGDPPTNNNPTTYPYLIPRSLITKAHLRIGELIDIRTNGQTVNALGPPYTI